MAERIERKTIGAGEQEECDTRLFIECYPRGMRANIVGFKQPQMAGQGKSGMGSRRACPFEIYGGGFNM